MVSVTRAIYAAGRFVSSAAFAYTAVWLLRQVNGHFSIYLGYGHHRKDICGKESRYWDWSLSSNCFRVGLLWPVLLWLAAIISSAALAVFCLLPQKFKSAGFCGVGNGEKPVRSPLGPTIMRDNRITVGYTIVTISSVQAALLWYAWSCRAEAAYFAHAYLALVWQFAVLVAVANAVFLAIYACSDRMLYTGLFPWPLPTLVLVHLLVNLAEIYYSFFTPATHNVPIFGRKATLYSNSLVVSTFMSVILVLTYTRVQLRPVFVRPFVPGPVANLQPHEYPPASDVEANVSVDEATPLSRHADQKPLPLVESPEFNVSWFSTLAFSWVNDILRRGTARQLDASDLYHLSESDTPIPNWRRYVRHRKPGRSLLVTMLIVFAPELILQAVLALVTSILQFSGPFFLQRILRSIEVLGSSNGQAGPNSGHGLLEEKSIRGAYLDAFGLLFSSLAAIVLTHQTQWVGRHIGFRLKGLLVAELSSKTLRRCGKGAREVAKCADDAVDEGNTSSTPNASASGKIMNLLTADFSHVCEVFIYLDSVYSLPFILVLGIWYMYLLLGVSALVGLSLVMLYIPLSKMLFKYLAKVEENMTSLSDERIAVITELLQGIRAVKLFGWESRFLEMVDERYERQLKYTWKLLLAWVQINVASSLTPTLVLVAIFAIYVIGFGNMLTAEVAFTSILVFQYVRMVLQRLPGFLTWVIGGYVALGRIDSYLGQPQVQDLEKRVARTDADQDKLGFEAADLEWDSPRSNAKLDSKFIVAGKDLSGAETPSITEQTPLLVDSTAVATPRSQSALSSAGGSYASLNRDDDNDLVRFTLKDIDVRFPHGVLSIVAGPTGSGKSSLLSALIGEMTLTRGRILLPTVNSRLDASIDHKYCDIIELSDEGLVIRDIAYVAQEAWLRNATIRENILFGEHYDASRYEEVLRVCALKPDLRILSAGDQTEIGERGVTLSGGQKQRVALARAVYSSRRILLIDDCLSAVDAHTAKHILMECLLSKTPLMLGRTRVLVTHHVSMCLPHAQYIVMLYEGRVSLKGNPADLQSQGVFTKVLAELESSEDKKEAADAKGKTTEQVTLSADVLDDDDPSKSANDTTSEDDYNMRRLNKIAEQRGLDPDGDLSALQGALVEDEERESGYVKSEVWLTYLNASGGKWFWVSLLALTLICELALVLQDYWIRVWVSAIGSGVSDDPSSQLTTHISIERRHRSAVYWIGIYMLLGIAAVFWRMLQTSYFFSGSIRAEQNLHSHLLRRVMRATPRFFDSTPLGRIVSRFSHDIKTTGYIMYPVVSLTGNILAMFNVVIIVSLVTPASIVIAIFVSLLYAGTAYYYLTSSRELKRLESTSMTPLLSLFGELILGVSTIRSFGAKYLYIKEALNRINAHNQPYYLVWATSSWMSVRMESAGAFVSFTCALFILGNLDWLDAGLAGFALTYSMSFSGHMLEAIRSYSANELNMNSVERISQYLSIEQEADLLATPENKPPSDWPKSGNVQIEDLVVEYVPGVPVLHGISLTAKHGENIGIVGRTGVGKSTMSLAFLRFIEAAQGRILLDDVDIAKIGLEELRRNVTIIPQDPVLFNGTIRFNLDPFGEYPDELVWDALKCAHLVRKRSSQTASTASISYDTRDIANEAGMERMSGIFTGLDADIKENGRNLSLGQKQLVALARALVRRSRLIIMDEATASVDFDTDDRIQRTIRGAEFANSTLFCIAHRLRTIIDYDRVLVLDKGKVAEFDTPWNLLQRECGIFRSMCEKSGEYERLVATAQRKSQANSSTIQ